MCMSSQIRFLAFSLILLVALVPINGDNYAIDPSNKSLLIAAGCFWCAEQAFEQYAPGVVEVVSGYAGVSGIENPTYRNHPGHYEVILIEYDPSKTTYELLVEYAWHNIDPFDGFGQFCDRGFSYYPVIFYDNEEEQLVAEEVLGKIVDKYDWDNSTIAVPMLERPVFWTAEDYHQDYYIKNPKNYGYYKKRCGRTQRLKEVWGEEEYYCYHDEETPCFNSTVVNEEGMEVAAEVNVKNAPEETVGLMPTVALIGVSVAAALTGVTLIACLYQRMRRNEESGEKKQKHKRAEEGTGNTLRGSL